MHRWILKSTVPKGNPSHAKFGLLYPSKPEAVKSCYTEQPRPDQ